MKKRLETTVGVDATGRNPRIEARDLKLGVSGVGDGFHGAVEDLLEKVEIAFTKEEEIDRVTIEAAGDQIRRLKVVTDALNKEIEILQEEKAALRKERDLLGELIPAYNDKYKAMLVEYQTHSAVEKAPGKAPLVQIDDSFWELL